MNHIESVISKRSILGKKYAPNQKYVQKIILDVDIAEDFRRILLLPESEIKDPG